MTFQMIKFSMIHLAPYQTKFYRDMIEILVSEQRFSTPHHVAWRMQSSKDDEAIMLWMKLSLSF